MRSFLHLNKQTYEWRLLTECMMIDESRFIVAKGVTKMYTKIQKVPINFALRIDHSPLKSLRISDLFVYFVFWSEQRTISPATLAISFIKYHNSTWTFFFQFYFLLNLCAKCKQSPVYSQTMYRNSLTAKAKTLCLWHSCTCTKPKHGDTLEQKCISMYLSVQKAFRSYTEFTSTLHIWLDWLVSNQNIRDTWLTVPVCCEYV